MGSASDSQQISYKNVLLIYFLVQFVSWILLEILEHKFGMQPAIRRQSSFSLMATNNTSNTIDRNQYAMTQRRLTKTLDKKGRFRIQTRGSIYLIKSLWQTTGLIYCIYELIAEPQWFIQHFYYLNENTIKTQKVQNICVLVIAYYCWEMSTNRYAKLQKSIAVHHWLSCIAAITIIYFDRFSPLITWYCIIGLFSAGIPINISLCIRSSSRKYKKMNKYIQGSLKFAAYWYLIHLLILLIGSCVIITNLFSVPKYYKSKTQLLVFILTILSMIGFFYNDIITVRALFELSRQNYALLSKHKLTKNLSKSATKKNPLKSNNINSINNIDLNDTDSYYFAYPISGTRTDMPTDNENDVLPSKLFDEDYQYSTDFTQFQPEHTDYAQQLYLDGDINTDGNIHTLQESNTINSIQTIKYNDNSELSRFDIINENIQNNENINELMVNIKFKKQININSNESTPKTTTATTTTSTVITPIPNTPNIPITPNSECITTSTMINDNYSDDSISNTNSNIIPHKKRESSVILEQIWNDNTPKNIASKILKIKEIESTPMVKITLPKNKKHIYNNDEIKSNNKLKLYGPLNPNHLSVDIIRLKKGNYSRKKCIKKTIDIEMETIPKHRQSQTLPYIPKLTNINTNTNNIQFKPEILPSQIKKIQSNLPPNASEIGIFKMTDNNTQQQVVLVKYLKINTTNNNINNGTPITTSIETISSQSPRTPTTNTQTQNEFDINKDEIIDINYKMKFEGINKDEITSNNYNKNKMNEIDEIKQITRALQLSQSQSQSNSVQKRWLKRLVFTINAIFSVDERMDDGIYIDLDPDELIHTLE